MRMLYLKVPPFWREFSSELVFVPNSTDKVLHLTA
jgi:hypothetical protein